MVTKSSLAVIQPGGGVPARAKAKPAASGLALINEVLDADIVQAMVDADRFRLQVQREDTYLGGEGEIRPELLEGAKPLHRRWLPDSARAFAAYDCLTEMTFPGAQRFPLTQADASTMLHYLFGAMGKRRNDEGGGQTAGVCRYVQSCKQRSRTGPRFVGIDAEASRDPGNRHQATDGSKNFRAVGSRTA